MLAILLAVATAMFPLPVPHNEPGAYSLVGRVTDTTGRPVADARIVILEASRSTRTDADGRFLLTDVADGTYGVSVAAIGFRPRVMRVTIRGQDTRLDVALTRTIIELAAIQTTATPLATTALESPQPLAVLQGDGLANAQAPSLGAVLEALPGMRNFSTGSGVGKPVIRGLTSNRVLVLENGQRIESQQWGDEHAPNVETATAERIEVIRGPASVLYGSDALGGVINVVQRELPDATGRPAFVSQWLTGSFSTNGDAPDGSLLVEGARGPVGFRTTLTARTQGDLRTPSGTLANSGLDMHGGSAALAVRGGWGTLGASFTGRSERLEIHEDPAEEPGATPFQRVGVSRGTLTGNIALGSARIEVDLGRESNHRREFEDASTTDFALGLQSINTMGNIHLHHATGGRFAGVLGISAMRSTVSISGEEVLVPASVTDNVGAYAFEQIDAGRWQFSVGARADWRRLRHEANEALGLDGGEQDWSAVTGNAGALLRVTESVALVSNIGRGFRAPSAFELFANGVHEGTVRYEVGNSALRTEASLNVDVAVRMQGHGVQGEIGVFRNAITNYIYPDPTGETDPESGFQVYRYEQGDAVLTGMEASADVHLRTWLHLRGGVDYTRGQNTTTDLPLAFVAPVRFTYNVRLEPRVPTVHDIYVQVGGETNARQRRLDPDDFAPAGYTLVNVSTGGAFDVAGRRVLLDLQARNILDTSYRSFLSRYKRYADDAGRNVIVRVTVS
ncbi:MAG: TonB-dependent receptor [Gemmatimonadales bacterium]|nr:TonB-dependent receptor [Gemmatimonadales bacterium]